MRLFRMLCLTGALLAGVPSWAQFGSGEFTASGDQFLPRTDDIWPWPWSVQCPFDWQHFEGRWVRSDRGQDTYFQFTIQKTDELGGHYFKVEYRRQDGTLIMDGLGYSGPQSREVRAGLQGLDQQGRWELLWIIVSFHAEPTQGEACGYQRRQVTVLTMTQDLNAAPSADDQFLIERLPAERPQPAPPQPPDQDPERTQPFWARQHR